MTITKHHCIGEAVVDLDDTAILSTPTCTYIVHEINIDLACSASASQIIHLRRLRIAYQAVTMNSAQLWKIRYLLIAGIFIIAWSIRILLLSETSLRQFAQVNSAVERPSIDKNANANIETVFIIAAVPYPEDYMAVWMQLECVTSGIDQVIICAPDTE
jgi:hypothetical protein